MDAKVQPGDIVVLGEYALVPPVLTTHDISIYTQSLEWYMANESKNHQTTASICGNTVASLEAPWLYEIACQVKQSLHTYLVVNMLEGAQGNTIFYNTNVVVDPTGAIRSVYRKVHVYGTEAGMITPGQVVTNGSNIVTIQADHWGRLDSDNKMDATRTSNVSLSIGHVICFDTMFFDTMGATYDALYEKQNGVTALLDGIPTHVPPVMLAPIWWVNTPPLEWAPHMLNALSGVFDGLLAVANSGYSYKTSGSGIYSYGTPTVDHWGLKKQGTTFALRSTLGDMVGTPCGKGEAGQHVPPLLHTVGPVVSNEADRERAHVEDVVTHVMSFATNVTSSVARIAVQDGKVGSFHIVGDQVGNEGMRCELEWELTDDAPQDGVGYMRLLLVGGWAPSVYSASPAATCFAVACENATCESFTGVDVVPVQLPFASISMTLDAPKGYNDYLMLPWFAMNNEDVMPYFEMGMATSTSDDTWHCTSRVDDQPSALVYGLFGIAGVDDR